MANNGTLKASGPNVFTGQVITFTLSAPLKLEPREANRDGVVPEVDGREPTHDVYVKAPHGGIVPAGAAWSKRIKRGDGVGKVMFSIQLDVPDLMERPVSLAAFPRDGGLWELTAERRRGGAPAPAPAASAPAWDAPPPADIDDEMPY